jgi:polyhydroxyalkanoate synthesis regulator phasin
VNDALRLSERSSLGATGDLESLRDQVQRFRRQADQLPPGDAQDRLARMLSDTRAVQRRLSTQNVPTQLRDDLNAMVGTLVQLRDLTGEGVEATTGLGTRDRYAVMDTMRLSQELNRRAMRASELAADENLNDVSNKIAEFRNEFRDFDTKAGRMDRDERRDRLDDLLKDAQAAQRDLAQRRVSGDLVDQWNGVVDLVVRLRDAS